MLRLCFKMIAAGPKKRPAAFFVYVAQALLPVLAA
jgi:hypothetical protein